MPWLQTQERQSIGFQSKPLNNPVCGGKVLSCMQVEWVSAEELAELDKLASQSIPAPAPAPAPAPVPVPVPVSVPTPSGHANTSVTTPHQPAPVPAFRQTFARGFHRNQDQLHDSGVVSSVYPKSGGVQWQYYGRGNTTPRPPSAPTARGTPNLARPAPSQAYNPMHKRPASYPPQRPGTVHFLRQ